MDVEIQKLNTTPIDKGKVYEVKKAKCYLFWNGNKLLNSSCGERFIPYEKFMT